MTGSGVLEGVRVLDFGRYVAGPYCACLLGDLGAEVIRIEKVGGGEDRFVGPLVEDDENVPGGLFLHCNRNKQGLTLNPMRDEGREVMARLVKTADVVIANLPAPTLSAMGLDYQSLRAHKPDIILTTVDAFGPGGPYSERVGFDGVGQSMSGSVYLSGQPGQPAKAAAPWVDFMTASLSAFATMAALFRRQQTGEGQHVQGALLWSAMTAMGGMLLEQDIAGPDRQPIGNRSHHAAPYDICQTKDGWIIVQVIGAPLWTRWLKVMGDDAWAGDPAFATDESRVHQPQQDILAERMTAWCAERTTEEALAALDEARIPAGPVYAPQQFLDDRHVAAAGLLNDMPAPFPGLPKPGRPLRTPIAMSATPPTIRARPPLIGEHTDAILADLGYSPAEIAKLHDARAV